MVGTAQCAFAHPDEASALGHAGPQQIMHMHDADGLVALATNSTVTFADYLSNGEGFAGQHVGRSCAACAS